jgi:hypothetical protein
MSSSLHQHARQKLNSGSHFYIIKYCQAGSGIILRLWNSSNYVYSWVFSVLCLGPINNTLLFKLELSKILGKSKRIAKKNMPNIQTIPIIFLFIGGFYRCRIVVLCLLLYFRELHSLKLSLFTLCCVLVRICECTVTKLV